MSTRDEECYSVTGICSGSDYAYTSSKVEEKIYSLIDDDDRIGLDGYLGTLDDRGLSILYIGHVRGNDNNNYLHDCVLRGKWKVMEIFVKHGIDIDSTNKNGTTALHMATFRKDHRTIFRLIHIDGINLDCKNKNGSAPLHLVAHSGDTFTCEMLLVKGANKDIIKNDYRTPAHVACKNGNIGVIELLYEHGADFKMRDNIGQSCYSYAVEGNYHHVIKFFDNNIIQMFNRDEWL